MEYSRHWRYKSGQISVFLTTFTFQWKKMSMVYKYSMVVGGKGCEGSVSQGSMGAVI